MYEREKYRARKDTVYIKEDIPFEEKAERSRDKYELEKERVRDRLVRQAIPHSDVEKIHKLKLKSEKVIGSIFDRVSFLETRISEINDAMELRKRLNAEIIRDIEKDIQEKDDISTLISDQNEKRNLKLDISILRKEKRHEQLQFWKDVTELMAELRNFAEQYETEKKIASLFQGD